MKKDKKHEHEPKKHEQGRWIACDVEHEYFGEDRKSAKMERKRVEAKDRSKYKKTDLGKTLTLTKDDKVQGSGILTTHFSDGATFPLRDAAAPTTPRDGAESLGSMATPPLPPPPPVPNTDGSTRLTPKPTRAGSAEAPGTGADATKADANEADAKKQADEEIDAGPQPTMKSPPVTASTAPPPLPPIDIQVSMPAPLPPPPPKAPASQPTPGKRQPTAGRMRMPTALAKTQPSNAAPLTKGKISGPTALLAVIALFAGAILAWLLRSRM